MSRLGIAVLAALLALGGCSKSQNELPSLVPVKGKLISQNNPVKGGSLMLQPVDFQGEFMVTAVVDPEGRFELATIKNNQRATGVPEGRYHVTYSPADTTAQVAPSTLPEPLVITATTQEVVIDLAGANQ